ncbi:MAG: thioesterase domain-containing protein [Caldilineaceae bacterium]
MCANPEQTLGAAPRFALPIVSACSAGQNADAPGQLSAPAAADDRPGKLELQLTNIWQRVLNRPSIGLTDNFFELGGHSLLALQLFAAIEKEITGGAKVPLALLLKAPTVAQLADALRHEGWSDAWSPLVVIKSGAPGKTPLFLVHAAGGNVLVYQDLARKLAVDQPVYGLQSQGLDGVQPLQSSVAEMAALSIREIQSVQPQGPYLLGGYCMGGTIALEMAQQLKAQGHEVALLALFETYNWSHIGAESLFDQIYFWVQKIEFHWRNFLLLNRTQKRTFFSEKLEALKSRSHIWRGVLRAQLGRNADAKSQHDVALAALWNNNDAVSLAYRASNFDGALVLIKAMKEYAIYKRPGLDLAALAQQGATVHTLPVYPAGMLVEPFVDHLAAALQASLNHAQGAETLG